MAFSELKLESLSSYFISCLFVANVLILFLFLFFFVFLQWGRTGKDQHVSKLLNLHLHELGEGKVARNFDSSRRRNRR